MSSDSKQLKHAQLLFKLRGFSVMKDALTVLLKYTNDNGLSIEENIQSIVGALRKINLTSSIVSKSNLEDAISLLSAAVENKDPIIIFNAFDIPKYKFDLIRKQFYLVKEKGSIHGEASSKIELYRERYELLKQRFLRNEIFKKSVLGIQESGSEKVELSTIESLISPVGKKYVLGIISQLEDGKFFLEDPTASIPLDFSNAKISKGFVFENCIVAAFGVLLPSGTFQALTLGFPPMEPRSETLSILGGIDFITSTPNYYNKEFPTLLKMEKEAVNEMFVFISDIWLDKDEVVEKLFKIFEAFENGECVPSLFVLIGNFSSKNFCISIQQFSSLQNQFLKLATILSSCPKIKSQSKICLVPGPNDPGPCKVLPQPPLPKFFTDELKNHIPNFVCTSNPARIRYYTQDIVIFREEMLHPMHRSSLLPPQESSLSQIEHLSFTLLTQGHVCPLPLAQKPIIWNLDHALHLHPVPDVMVCADVFEQSKCELEGVTCFNPGSFSLDSTFVVYRPSERLAELSNC